MGHEFKELVCPFQWRQPRTRATMGAAAEWQVLLGWTAVTLVEPPLRQELQRERIDCWGEEAAIIVTIWSRTSTSLRPAESPSRPCRGSAAHRWAAALRPQVSAAWSDAPDLRVAYRSRSKSTLQAPARRQRGVPQDAVPPPTREGRPGPTAVAADRRRPALACPNASSLADVLARFACSGRPRGRSPAVPAAPRQRSPTGRPGLGVAASPRRSPARSSRSSRR